MFVSLQRLGLSSHTVKLFLTLDSLFFLLALRILPQYTWEEREEANILLPEPSPCGP